ncbi:MAG: CvpA family protein, partial [Clostridia bacterium]|nr:CvpA family protein [Clostridia bacterium]
MSYILDGIIILIILLGVFLSAKKGFVRTLIEVVGFVAAIVVAFTLSSPLANTIYDKMIEPSVVKTVEAVATDGAENASAAVDAVWSKMPAFITESSFFNLSKDSITSTVQAETANGSAQLAQTVSDSFVAPAVTKLISVFISVILVIVLLFVVKILAKYLNKLFSFSIVGDINKTLGGLLGLVKGAAIA